MKKAETIDENFLLIRNFLNGLNSITIIPNSQDCAGLSQIFLNDANSTGIQLSSNDGTESLDQVRMVSSLISS